MVISIARRHARPGLLPLSDLIQEGNLGLIRAVERFEPFEFEDLEALAERLAQGEPP